MKRNYSWKVILIILVILVFAAGLATLFKLYGGIFSKSALNSRDTSLKQIFSEVSGMGKKNETEKTTSGTNDETKKTTSEMNSKKTPAEMDDKSEKDTVALKDETGKSTAGIDDNTGKNAIAMNDETGTSTVGMEDETEKTFQSEAFMLTVFFPDEKQKEAMENIPEGKIIDMRPHLQNLVNHYGDLDKNSQQKLLKIVYPEIYTKTIGHFQPIPFEGITLCIGLPAFALSTPLLLEPEEYEIFEGITVKSFDPEFITNHDTIVSTVFDSLETFEMLGFQKPSFQIEIILYDDMPTCLASYSVFIPPDFIDLAGKPVFRIFIDPGSSQNVMQASLVHELFHAWQEEALLTGSIIPFTGETIDWLREATALWAVDQVYPENDFELGSVRPIYVQPTIEYPLFEDCTAHTWYQMFFYFTKVLNSCDNSYVHSLFTGYKMNMNLDAAFNTAHAGRQFFNQEFAKLGMALFGGVDESKTFESEEPFYPTSTIAMDEDNQIPLEEILDDNGSDWREHVFETPGFHYKLIDIPQDYNQRLIISQNLSMTVNDQRTGMRVAALRNDEWQWIDVFDEPSHLVIDTGGSAGPVDAILLMLYSSSFEASEIMQYKVALGTPRIAKGMIQINWEKEYNLSRDASQKDTITTIIIEELKKSAPGAENALDETLAYMATGERYFIQSMDVTQTYSSIVKKGKEETKTIGAGNFIYDAPSEGSGEMGLPGMPGLPDLSNMIENQLIPSLEQLEEMMGGLEDSSGGVPVLPGEQDMLIPELPDLSGLSLPDLGMGGSSQSRIVIWPDVGAFEFYPVLPPQIMSEKWMTYEYTHTWPDPVKPGATKTEQQTSEDTPYELLPLWFINPDYDPDSTGEEFQMQPEDMDSIEDTKELMDMMSAIQAGLNKVNIQKLIDNPQIGYEIDLKNSIDPVPESAIMMEKAMFNNKTFEAELTAMVISKKGNSMTLTITVHYDFE